MSKFDDYIKNVKEQLVCNASDEYKSEYITYEYSNEEVDANLDYFMKCMERGLSPYKSLLFLKIKTTHKLSYKHMNVKQGLKEKNKLVTELKSLYEITKTHNSIEEGNVRRYSVVDTLSKVVATTLALVDLKARIHRANQPVFHQIFLMAELKGQIKMLRAMPVEEGKVSERYGSTVCVKSVEINIAERDMMVKSIEKQIEQLQDELDTHNATTQI